VTDAKRAVCATFASPKAAVLSAVPALPRPIQAENGPISAACPGLGKGSSIWSAAGLETVFDFVRPLADAMSVLVCCSSLAWRTHDPGGSAAEGLERQGGGGTVSGAERARRRTDAVAEAFALPGREIGGAARLAEE